jgi:hypothetical protein
MEGQEVAVAALVAGTGRVTEESGAVAAVESYQEIQFVEVQGWDLFLESRSAGVAEREDAGQENQPVPAGSRAVESSDSDQGNLFAKDTDTQTDLAPIATW